MRHYAVSGTRASVTTSAEAKASQEEPLANAFCFAIRWVGVAGFYQHVLAHDAQVGHAVLHVAGNVVVAA